VRFIRYHVDRFGVYPLYLAVTGASAGGHWNLLTSVAPSVPYAEADDPVNRASSLVQAVVGSEERLQTEIPNGSDRYLLGNEP